MRSAHRLALLASASMLSAVLPLAVQAAEAPTAVEEVVVTANKRAERLQDVPASVTALTADTLTAAGAVKFEDYIAKVPGLAVDNTAAGGGLNQISMRGVSTGQGGNPTVGVYIDDAPFGASTTLGVGAVLAPDLDPSDLARIEVLRGPQGTLYGAGAMGGLVKFVTAAPEFDRFSGHLEVSGDHADGGESGYGLRGSANVPVSDRFAIRVSGFDRRDPGFVDDAVSGAKDVNTSRHYGGRVAAAVKFNDNWTLRLSALDQELRSDGPPIVDYDAFTGARLYGDLQQARAPGTGHADASYELYDIHLEGDLGWATLVSATSYGKLTTDINTDVSALYGPLVTGALGIPDVGAAIQTNYGLDKFSQELRLSSPSEAKLAWQVGGFYTHEHVDLAQSVPTFNAVTGGPLVPSLPSLVNAHVPSRFEEAALFGDVTYHFSPRFDLTGGVRYSHNKQTAEQTTSGLLLGGVTSTASLNSDDSSVTWLVTPRFHISDSTMVYARVATGYRPGGPNIVVTNQPASYGPDKVTNYEAGVKTELFDRRLTLDLSAFYIDWQDVQVNQLSPFGTSFYTNAGKARSEGVEATADWRPVAGLEIVGNLAYLDATLQTNLPGPNVGSKGDDLPTAPHWSGQVSADYQFPLSGQWNGLVGASYRVVGDRFGDFSSSPAIPRYRLPSYAVADLRAGVKSDRWAVTAYVKNLGDSRGQVSAANLGAIQEVAVIQPRTVGVSLSADF